MRQLNTLISSTSMAAFHFCCICQKKINIFQWHSTIRQIISMKIILLFRHHTECFFAFPFNHTKHLQSFFFFFSQKTYGLRSPLKNCKVLLHWKSPVTDHLTYIVCTAINEVDLPLKPWKSRMFLQQVYPSPATYFKWPFLRLRLI